MPSTHHRNPHHHKRSHHKKSVLVADVSGSTCFSDLRWSDGTAYFTFARDGFQDSIEMSRSDFEDWMNSDSLGQYYNSM